MMAHKSDLFFSARLAGILVNRADSVFVYKSRTVLSFCCLSETSRRDFVKRNKSGSGNRSVRPRPHKSGHF